MELAGNQAGLALNYGDGYKPGGGSWAAVSDQRVKHIEGGYNQGLDAIVSLRPVRYRINADYSFGSVAVHKSDKMEVGLIAQEAEDAMPELFTIHEGVIDGIVTPDLRVMNGSALTYALINAVRELHDRVRELEGNRGDGDRASDTEEHRIRRGPRS